MTAPAPVAPGDPGFAPAKINLALHVTGRRADGYHLLDSLVVFADVGDRLRVEPAPRLDLRIEGPEAAALSAGDDNLVLRAARALGGGQAGQGARITLEKHLPVASGIGGGSADAAAALRLLSRLWGVPLPDAAAVLALGADVPVCLAGGCARMSGIGEVVEPAPGLPRLWAVLANPRIALSTPQVFGALARRDNPRLPPLPRLRDAAAVAGWLHGQRNDLELPALVLAPAIAGVLAGLADLPGALIARMSGSGATCFALFAEERSARAGAAALCALRPEWWVAAARLGDAPDAGG